MIVEKKDLRRRAGLYTLHDAADALGISYWGLRQNLWVKNGPTGDSSWQGGFSEGWQGK